MLRVTTIPEEAATEQMRKFGPIAAYLEKKLGMKVEFTPVSDYPAAVEALVNKKVDLVWFGGFTFVQANIRSGGKMVPIAQREEDTRFQSVFIAKTDSGIKTLADLKGKQISFGSQSSTSGHLMPRSFLLQAGLTPETDFRRIAYSGAHDATIASVVSGKVDAAALDITVWKKFASEGKVDTKAVDVFYTTRAVLQLQLVGACRHAGRPARQAAKGAARHRPGHARGRRDPEAQPRHPLHPDHARQLQGHRGRRPQRRPALIHRVKLDLEAVAARHPAARAGAAPALQALRLHVAAGEQVAVIGPSGAGKTSLLQVMACAMPPSAGRLLLDGTDPWSLPRPALQRLRGQLLLAPQVPPLPPRQRVVTAVLAGRLPALGTWASLRSLVLSQ